LAVFQLPIVWLNALASMNMELMSATLAVFQLPMAGSHVRKPDKSPFM
jgi:hypothetical protein